MKKAEYSMSSTLGLPLENCGILWERTGKENWKYVDLLDHFSYILTYDNDNVPVIVI